MSQSSFCEPVTTVGLTTATRFDWVRESGLGFESFLKSPNPGLRVVPNFRRMESQG